jgi:hypothetical protein
MQSDGSVKAKEDIAKGHTGGLEPEGMQAQGETLMDLTERYQGEESCEKKAFGKEVPLKALPVRPAKGPAAQKVYERAHTYGSARDI